MPPSASILSGLTRMIAALRTLSDLDADHLSITIFVGPQGTLGALTRALLLNRNLHAPDAWEEFDAMYGPFEVEAAIRDDNSMFAHTSMLRHC
jgi:hypothetical protein